MGRVTSLDRVGGAIAKRLIGALGEAAAEQLAGEVLSQLRLRRLETADQRLRFGNALIERGGVTEVVGRSLQTQALLHGAIKTLDTIIKPK